ncbi:MAG: hypothetical protein SGPRY_007456 [Prymnesium sp.]
MLLAHKRRLMAAADECERKREWGEEQGEGKELDAALALSGMLSHPRALPIKATDLERFRVTNQYFPCTGEKGWFVKTLEGADIPFLERLLLILSFPNAKLISRRDSRLSDAIRWKTAEAARLCGAPEGAPCLEIVDVPLFEAEIYPQYASGSFNKTATKWGLISPSGKKLSRECMYMPATRVEGEQIYPLSPLPEGLAADAVNEYIARHLRPLAYVHRTLPSNPRVVAAPPTLQNEKQQEARAGQPDEEKMSRIMMAVKETTGCELSLTQLQAILALKEEEAAPAATHQVQEGPALQMSLARRVRGATASVSPSPKRQAITPSWDELRVTLWDTKTRKRVSGTSYKGSLASFLAMNPHMEVYNRQDEAPKPGQQLLAGQKMHTIETADRHDAKVVIWHSAEMRKLSVDESPSQSELYKFLRAHPEMVVYDNQDKPICDSQGGVAAPASAVSCMEANSGKVEPDAMQSEPTKAAVPAPVQFNFKKLTNLGRAAMGKCVGNNSSLGPVGGLLSYSALAQLQSKQATSPSPQLQLAQLQTLLHQQSPTTDSLALLQAAQMARISNIYSGKRSFAPALASFQGSDVAWKQQTVFK